MASYPRVHHPSLLLAGCVVHEAVAIAPGAPASFDRSWNAALGAAQDVGFAITAARRSSGIIQGPYNAARSTIALIPQADSRLRGQFDASLQPANGALRP